MVYTESEFQASQVSIVRPCFKSKQINNVLKLFQTPSFNCHIQWCLESACLSTVADSNHFCSCVLCTYWTIKSSAIPWKKGYHLILTNLNSVPFSHLIASTVPSWARDFPASTDHSPPALRWLSAPGATPPLRQRSGLAQNYASSEASRSSVDISCRSTVLWKKSAFWAGRGKARWLSSGDCC